MRPDNIFWKSWTFTDGFYNEPVKKLWKPYKKPMLETIFWSLQTA